MSRAWRVVAVTGIASLATLATVPASNAGYLPVTPPGPPVPGGFSTVLASKTIGAAGGVLVAAEGGIRFRLTIRPHELGRRVQFTLTRPKLAGLRHAVPKGTRVRTGFALLTNRVDGGQIRGWFSRTPGTITITGRALTKSTRAYRWNQARHRFVRVRAQVRRGRVVVTSRQFAEFILVAPA